jgi:catechol 2,3-dioxygenase-like lactoylglutathione lyase family enzyme
MSLVQSHDHLHSDRGPIRGEHPGRSANPIIKVHDLAWLEFEKPDLKVCERFARAFGFAVAWRSANEIHLRGTDPGAPCAIIRRGPSSRFAGMAYLAHEDADVVRLASATNRQVRRLPDQIGGLAVDLTDPVGVSVRVVSGANTLPPLPSQVPLPFNVDAAQPRINATQRPPREPARVQRLGHIVLQTTHYYAALNWYLEHLGLIVSDFQYYPGQRERGSVMGFLRCDRGPVPADHHTLALALGPANRYLHSAYQVCDLDALAAGGQYLVEQGYRRSWGIGRHVQGSQIFDYWRDPDGLMVEHFTDGDLFDATLEPGWAPLSASGLAQWGPPATRNFLGVTPRSLAHDVTGAFSALRSENDWHLRSMVGMLKAGRL